MSELALKLERLTGLGCINLRGDSSNAAFVDVVQEVCDLQLPITPNTVSGTERRLFWLGPNEWLLLCDSSTAAELSIELSSRLQGQFAAVNLLSGAQVVYRLAGADARALLAKGCSLDLHPSVFQSGMCAQTGLAKTAVLIQPLADGAGFELVVRRSFADYAWAWLLRAGREYGIEVA